MWQRAERTRDLAMSSNGFRCHARLLDKRNAPPEQHRPAGNQPANISLTRVAIDTLTAPPVTAQGHIDHPPRRALSKNLVANPRLTLDTECPHISYFALKK